MSTFEEAALVWLPSEKPPFNGYHGFKEQRSFTGSTVSRVARFVITLHCLWRGMLFVWTDHVRSLCRVSTREFSIHPWRNTTQPSAKAAWPYTEPHQSNRSHRSHRAVITPITSVAPCCRHIRVSPLVIRHTTVVLSANFINEIEDTSGHAVVGVEWEQERAQYIPLSVT